ncbi:MAG: hypothetical protein AB8B71_20380, partial [Paracoccaceae bacterium]
SSDQCRRACFLASDTTSIRGLDLLLLITATATKFQINQKDGPRRMITHYTSRDAVDQLGKGRKQVGQA